MNNKPSFITDHRTKPLSSRAVNKLGQNNFVRQGKEFWAGRKGGRSQVGVAAVCCDQPCSPRGAFPALVPALDGLPAPSPAFSFKAGRGRAAGGMSCALLLPGKEKALPLFKVIL